jgi:hypothetical protein
MTTSLDVLLMESHTGTADSAAAALEQAGHHVLRCHAPGDRGFACTELDRPGSCPLNRPVDVALLVRREVTPHPTPLEDGLRCAVRAHVPVVEDGPEQLDPFDPWLSGRVVGGDVVAACEQAADRAFASFEREVLQRISGLLSVAGVPGSDVSCRIVADWPRLLVNLDVDAEIEPSLEQALAVRALDAVRARPSTLGSVDVEVHARPIA